MKNVVVLIADGSEEIETLTPVDFLRRAGVTVTLVSVGSGSRTVTCARKVSVNADISLDAYLSAAYEDMPDAVVVPGGMPGTRNIAASRSALSFISEMYRNGKLVCAICAAPALVLSRTGVLEGKSWTCYPEMEQEEEAVQYACTHKADVPFVHDGNIITGRGAGAAAEFSLEIIRTLLGEESAAQVKKAVALL